ncbi:stage V sporulation protein AA [Hespellia stercorisuis]|uniref:Stage V sporulation protein AA n=1 Tax=Hespellia stercorisuis DSM 15480 TaxID=1121950 RepID=A0A1M6NHH9_9FIRM|nr:stage V sporulation protein AA [Hespellia stercorisuis]SHJ95086.1 stage V sporulation protein AA [Hespellia stercorisuis DSM 15480]
MSEKKETVYIKGDRNVEVKEREIRLGDVVSLECANSAMAAKLKCLKLMTIPEQGEHRAVVSVLRLIACIHEHYPNVDVQNMGETDLIITVENQKTPGGVAEALKVAAVVLITFAGSAFSIMAFNNDVSTTKLFSQVYELVTGSKSNGFTILEVTYCVGLIIGILVFFNHFGKKRFSVDPTPMEVEMRLYENDIATTVTETYARKGQEKDVDQTGHTGVSGN